MRLLKLWPLWVALSLLAGCSSSPGRSTPAPVVESSVGGSVIAPAAGREAALTAPTSGPGGVVEEGGVRLYPYRQAAPPAPVPTSEPLLALADRAERQRRGGDMAGAASTLERALRIEPRNPRLWNRLARIRLDQRRYQESAGLAAKSNALARNLPELERDNWGIIAAARRHLGDARGAREAARRAQGE